MRCWQQSPIYLRYLASFPKLGQSSEAFRQAPPSPKSEESDFAPDSLKDSLEILATVLGQLSVAKKSVQSKVYELAEPVSAEALQICGVNADDIIKPISTLPNNTVEFTFGKAGTENRLLSGGSGQYVITETNEQAGVSVKQPIPLGAAVTISTTDTTPVGKNSAIDSGYRR